MEVETTATAIETIIERALALRPTVAATQVTGELSGLCTTPRYDRVLIDGREHPLSLVDGTRYAAVYVRVSTLRQTVRKKKKGKSNALEQMDGLSPRDQIHRGITECVKRGWAFRVFSDSGIHGDVPHRDKAAMERQRAKRATLYDEAFRAVIMTYREYTDAEIASMEAYLARTLKKIRTQGRLELPSPEDNFRVRASTRVNFRPGLTVLRDSARDIHTVLLSDLSRLSRDDTLTTELLEFFADPERPISLLGTVDNLSSLNDRHGVGKLTALLQGWFAAEKLREVIKGCLRGQLTLISQGYPLSKIPSWCERDEDGVARLIPERAAAIRDMVDLFLEGKEDGTEATYHFVCRRLAELGHAAPKTHWNIRTVQDILRNASLLGYQEFYGLRFKVLPEVINDPHKAWLLEEKLRTRDAANTRKYEIKRKEGYLLQGLVYCSCGRTLTHGILPNRSDTFYCRKREGEIRDTQRNSHFQIIMRELDGFFNTLMEEFHEEVFLALDEVDEGRRLEGELQRWETELSRRRQQRHQAEIDARPKAEENASAVADPSDADYQDWVRRAIAKMTKSFRDSEDEAEAEVKHYRRQLTELLPSGSIKEQAKRWADLNNLQRNAILRSIFREFRVSGAPGDEVLVPILRGATDITLPPIRLKTEKRAGKITTYRRTLPSPADWLGSLGIRKEWDAESDQQVEVVHIPPIPLEQLERVAPKMARDISEELEIQAWEDAEIEAGGIPAIAEKWVRMQGASSTSQVAE